MHRFETEGLISSEAFYDSRGNPYRTVRLTEVGGALWESERLPDWNLYVTDMHPKNRISIFGHTADTCDRYFQVARDAGLINYDGGRIRRGGRSPRPHLLAARSAGLSPLRRPKQG